jgi:hypothetical protein
VHFIAVATPQKRGEFAADMQYVNTVIGTWSSVPTPADQALACGPGGASWRMRSADPASGKFLAPAWLCWLPAAGYSHVMAETGATSLARDANPPLLYGKCRTLARLRPVRLGSRYPGHSRVQLVLPDGKVAPVADTIRGSW